MQDPHHAFMDGDFCACPLCCIGSKTSIFMKKIYKQWALVSNQAPTFINSRICSCYKGRLIDDNNLNLMTNRGITTLELSAFLYISSEEEIVLKAYTIFRSLCLFVHFTLCTFITLIICLIAFYIQ